MEWDPEDRAKFIALSQEKAARCTLCGTGDWEWEENAYAYEAAEKWCKGCYTKNSYSDSLGERLPGTTVELVKVTPQMRAQQQLNHSKRRRMMED